MHRVQRASGSSRPPARARGAAPTVAWSSASESVGRFASVRVGDQPLEARGSTRSRRRRSRVGEAGAWPGPVAGESSARIFGSAAMRSPSEPPAARRSTSACEDVDAALGQAADVGELGLDLGALALHVAELVERAAVEPVEVLGREDPVDAALVLSHGPVRLPRVRGYRGLRISRTDRRVPSTDPP